MSLKAPDLNLGECDSRICGFRSPPLFSIIHPSHHKLSPTPAVEESVPFPILHYVKEGNNLDGCAVPAVKAASVVGAFEPEPFDDSVTRFILYQLLIQ